MSILINTKLRKSVLTYFFSHPDENYYVREIAAIINDDPGNLSRELNKLEKEGLFKSFIRGNSKYYSLSKEYPLYKEIKEIIFKTEGIEGSLRNIIAKYKGISLAFIYGSYAKENENKSSDIDLLVVGQFPLDEFTRKVRNLESKIGREINFTHYDKDEFKKETAKSGSFLNLITNGKIIILKGEVNAAKTHRKAA
ncbi:MAG: nucleotidyltransferase domain-containing protein [bacterium]|nr:nucleotidyltransferase domain-containing protein [bacterium]